jgi:hypothetical protein
MTRNPGIRSVSFRKIFSFLIILMPALAVPLSASDASDWKQMIWQGEKAWESTSAGWTAIVSEERSRLVGIVDTVTGDNLLFAPPTKGAVSWGGHRCWLGPQSGWKTDWPPPVDWEASAADQVVASGALLTVTHPQTDDGYPGLSRTYQWRGGVLHCELRWQGGRRHAIHILQLPSWSLVHVRRAVTKDLPFGYAWPQSTGTVEALTDKALPDGVSRVEGDKVMLWHANITAKVAFAPQEIVAEIGKHQLKMRRGLVSGCTEKSPDFGLLTQVYVGDWQNPFVEIEQLSPYADGADAFMEILVEPGRPKQLPVAAER